MAIPGSRVKRNQMEKRQEIRCAMPKRLYTLKESANYLGRSEWSMRELIWAGRIPIVRVEGGRKIFLDIEDLNNFIRQNKSIYL